MMQWERTGLNCALVLGALWLGLTGGPAWADKPGAAIDAGTRAELPAGRASVQPQPLVPPTATAPRFVATHPPYPVTRRDGLVDHVFGEDVPDPYRWLEADLHHNREVADWVARQTAATSDYLAHLPGRDALAARIRALYDFERFSVPHKAGKRYFYLRNSGLQNQSELHVREGLNGASRVLIDPNNWSADGTVALDAWVPSHSGRYLAWSEQRAGSDWRTIRLADVGNGHVLDDRLEWANDTLIAWVGDQGFLYSRFPAPGAGASQLAPTFNKAVWFHRVGTAQTADELVYATPDHPEWGHKAQVTADGHWAVIISEASTGARHAIHLIDLTDRAKFGPAFGSRSTSEIGQRRWHALPLVPDMTHDWKLVDGIGDRLWFLTNDGAPNYQLVSVDPGARPGIRVVVGQRSGTMEGGRIVGDRIIVSYQQNGKRVAMVTDLNGRPARSITINAIGAATGFDGRPGDPETFYQFSSFNQPPAVYRLDLRSGAVTAFALPKIPFDPADYVIEERNYRSKDGTEVPLTIVRKRALANAHMAAPTLLYGYGGFDIALNPTYSPVRMAWLEAGGVFAVASIRGGGERGPAWHEAGMLARRQNSFDDFIAAGEYLIREGIAPRGGLAVQGGSNGGMVVGAVVNQRPDLFAAANPDVGVMDMLRFDRFTQGRSWADDYGHPDREADWRILRGISPYHNVHAGDYPAILVTTADSDDRVVPAHSFKYVAALQAVPTGDKPHLLRVESDAGHGGGRPLDKVIAGGADVMAFLGAWTGLTLP